MDEIVTLSNKQGMSVVCSSVGAGLVDICVPDRNGTIQSVLVRPNKYSQYFRAGGHFGKPCGRTAGRISPNVFELDGKKFAIDTGNNKTFALHGGREGFSEKAFDYEKKYDKESSSIVFSYFSKDGEGGYPGNLHVKITFVLMNDENRLIIKHEASTDKPTLCNLTCHAYFNLSGNAKENILNQILYLNSSKVGAVDCNTVAQSIVDVDKNFDFRTPHKIGDFIEEPEVQKTTLGYDHPFLLDETNEKKVQASLFDPLTGRFLEIRTSYDACVVYSSNHPSEFIIQNGEELSKYDAICLEMQHFPNSVNSNFIKDKKDILKPEQNYSNFIEYSFSTK
jgi:aldose 1-epimerase